MHGFTKNTADFREEQWNARGNWMDVTVTEVPMSDHTQSNHMSLNALHARTQLSTCTHVNRRWPIATSWQRVCTEKKPLQTERADWNAGHKIDGPSVQAWNWALILNIFRIGEENGYNKGAMLNRRLLNLSLFSHFCQFHAWTLSPSISCPSFSAPPTETAYIRLQQENNTSNH